MSPSNLYKNFKSLHPLLAVQGSSNVQPQIILCGVNMSFQISATAPPIDSNMRTNRRRLSLSYFLLKRQAHTTIHSHLNETHFPHFRCVQGWGKTKSPVYAINSPIPHSKCQESIVGTLLASNRSTSPFHYELMPSDRLLLPQEFTYPPALLCI